jgi:hypothetical protein
MLKEIVATFFGGSPEREVQALIGLQADLASDSSVAAPRSPEVSQPPTILPDNRRRLQPCNASGPDYSRNGI